MPTQNQRNPTATLNLALTLSCFTLLSLTGCDGELHGEIVYDAQVSTVEDGDKELEFGESTSAKAKFYYKEWCSYDVSIQWETCLKEFENGEEGYTYDGTRFVCASFVTKLECLNNKFEKRSTDCKSGYCEYVVGRSDPMECGWRMEDMTVTREDSGEILQDFNQSFIDSLGFELLPVGRR